MVGRARLVADLDRALFADRLIRVVTPRAAAFLAAPFLAALRAAPLRAAGLRPAALRAVAFRAEVLRAAAFREPLPAVRFERLAAPAAFRLAITDSFPCPDRKTSTVGPDAGDVNGAVYLDSYR
jgi:hypothetical protein